MAQCKQCILKNIKKIDNKNESWWYNFSDRNIKCVTIYTERNLKYFYIDISSTMTLQKNKQKTQSSENLGAQGDPKLQLINIPASFWQLFSRRTHISHGQENRA